MEETPPNPNVSTSGTDAGTSESAQLFSKLTEFLTSALNQSKMEMQSMIDKNKADMEALIAQKLQEKKKEGEDTEGEDTNDDEDVGNIPKSKEIEFKAFRTCGATEFKGTADPVEAYEWISHIEEMFDVSKCAQADCVRYTTALLRESARDWWRNEKQAMAKDKLKKLDWKGFKGLFFKEYCPEDVQWQYSRDFLNLKQGEMSVSDYRTEFRRKAVFGEAYIRSERERVRLFVEGLRMDIREDLEGKDIATFEKAAELARTREKFLVLKYAESSSPPAKRTRSEPPPTSQRNRSPGSNRSFSRNSRPPSVSNSICIL